MFSLALVSCKKEAEVTNTGEVQEVESVTATNKHVASPEDGNTVVPTNPNGKYAKMEFSKLEHDFGSINSKDVVETTFEFTNTGEANLVILKAEGSCGCTVPEYPKEPIAPGAKGTIRVSFSPAGKTAMQSKTVTLTTNTATGTEQLTIKANISK